MDAYRKMNKRYFLDEMLKPYSIAGCTCVAKVKKWAEIWKINPEHIAYFFEDGDKDKGDLIHHMKIAHGFEPHFLKERKECSFSSCRSFGLRTFVGKYQDP